MIEFEGKEPTMIEINAVGLQYEGEIEIVGLHEMIESEAQEENPDEEPDHVELNALEFFIKAVLYFEGEADGQLCFSEQSPASLVRSETQRFNINAIKTALITENRQCGSSQLLNDPISTREESSYSLLGKEGRTLDFKPELLCNESKQYCRNQL